MRPRHINARELAARRVQIGFHIRVQTLIRRARHGGILLRAVGKHGHEAEIARALIQLVEEQLYNIEVAVQLCEQQQLHDLDGTVVQTALEDVDLLTEGVEAVGHAQGVACQRIELRLGNLTVLGPQPYHKLVCHVMVQARVYGEQCLAAVWTFYTKDRQILYLCPQLGISVDIDMVDHLVFGFHMTVRTFDHHNSDSSLVFVQLNFIITHLYSYKQVRIISN